MTTTVGPDASPAIPVRRCRACGCTDYDCHDCIIRLGTPCEWVEQDLCSACHQLGYNTLIRVNRQGSCGSTVASVRVGGKTLRASTTGNESWAAERVAEKAKLAVRAKAVRIERYHVISQKAARAALYLEFK